MKYVTFKEARELRMFKRNRLPDILWKRQFTPFSKQEWMTGYVPKRSLKYAMHRTLNMKPLWTTRSGREVFWQQRRFT